MLKRLVGLVRKWGRAPRSPPDGFAPEAWQLGDLVEGVQGTIGALVLVGIIPHRLDRIEIGHVGRPTLWSNPAVLFVESRFQATAATRGNAIDEGPRRLFNPVF
ncbi:MAG: hypothetical protein KF778_15480 [Rhodocyclaceae bacterium]|nr:hypothetical protein [Rhodocyclaceae bacterium]